MSIKLGDNCSVHPGDVSSGWKLCDDIGMRKNCVKIHPLDSPRARAEPVSPSISEESIASNGICQCCESTSPMSFHSSSRIDNEEGEDSSKLDVSLSSESLENEFSSIRDSLEFSSSVVSNTSDNHGHPNNVPLDSESVAVLTMPTSENRGSSEHTLKPPEFENNDLIWLPPPPEDENDEAENSLSSYEDEGDDTFTSSSSLSGLNPSREKHKDGNNEPLKAVIQNHFRALVSQLLQGENIEVLKWLDIVTKLSWESAYFVKPDTSKGGSMDPIDYVKIKCLATGVPDDSCLVKGIVCTKNIKHKRMTTQYKNPRLFLLGGALEYQSVANPLASLETLVQQEKDHLNTKISKIEALRPNVLLVERTVSPYAQECLLAKDISLVPNVKRALLERIARCTGAVICPSLDNISSTRCGHCEHFRVERISEEHENPNQTSKKSSKTLMHFEGCSSRLGCTVILKGSNREELKKIKYVVQFAVFAAYHLSLETSFLADEGASLPKVTMKKSTSDLAEHQSSDLLSALLDDSGISSLSNGCFDFSLENAMFDDNDDATQTNPVDEASSNDYFSSVDTHQSILVSFSSRSVTKAVVCERSRLQRIKFYGSSDKPLGRYLREDLFDQAAYCRSCNDPSECHVVCFTHQQGNLTINVRSLPVVRLPGEKDGKIWMWHRCLRCIREDGIPPATRRVVMSDAAWGLSFGKFLELSFSNNATANRVAPCGHSLQKDCLRFYGFGGVIAFFRYSPIDIHNVHLPPSPLEFAHNDRQEWIVKETTALSAKMNSFYDDVSSSLDSIESRCERSISESAAFDGLVCRVSELKERLRNERAAYNDTLNSEADILKVNQIRREFLLTSHDWGHQLYSLEALSVPTQDHFEESETAPHRAQSFESVVTAQKKSPHPALNTPSFKSFSFAGSGTSPPLTSGTSEGAGLLRSQKGAVVGVYEDDPASMISYVLTSNEYDDWTTTTDTSASKDPLSTWQSFDTDDDVQDSTRGSPHFTASYSDDEKLKFTVTCYFAKQFDSLRKTCCPKETDFIRSLSRCQKWNAQGGKSNVYFAKSLDDRFIIKQVKKTELDSFAEFSQEYFKYLADSLNLRSPTCLAKILGMFHVAVKQKGEKEVKMDVMVMENLFYRRQVSRIYDLKGSARARYNAEPSEKNPVLLDTNLVESLRTDPILMGSRAKRNLERAIWNDTSFLAGVDVMDYSLLVGVDENKKELVVGIIDYLRQYTWDKHLETWVKASGILGGPKNAAPTIVSPVQYKKRFRKAMTSYFLPVPDQWSS